MPDYTVRTMFKPEAYSTSECRLRAATIRHHHPEIHVEVRSPQLALVTEVTAADALDAILLGAKRFANATLIPDDALVRATRKDTNA